MDAALPVVVEDGALGNERINNQLLLPLNDSARGLLSEEAARLIRGSVEVQWTKYIRQHARRAHRRLGHARPLVDAGLGLQSSGAW